MIKKSSASTSSNMAISGTGSMGFIGLLPHIVSTAQKPKLKFSILNNGIGYIENPNVTLGFPSGIIRNTLRFSNHHAPARSYRL